MPTGTKSSSASGSSAGALSKSLGIKSGHSVVLIDAPVGFRHADDEIDALGLRRLRARQHRIGLADARRGAKKNAQLSSTLLVAQGKERVRIRSAVEVSVVAGQRRLPSEASASL